MSLLRSAPAESTLSEANAFAAMYQKNYLNVFRFLMALSGGQAQDAEDMTAETFLRAWDARRRFQGDGDAVLRWLFTIARRILIDRRRYSAVRPESDLDDSAPDDAPEAEAVLIRTEQMQEVLQALQRLPVAQREMIVLRYMLGWRVNAIAAHLQVPENSVSVALRRAVQQLQRWLAPA